MHLNTVTLIGRVSSEPELKYTQNGRPVARFDLVVEFDTGEGKVFSDTFPVVIWGKSAEAIAEQLNKGLLVGVQGQVRTRTDGSNRKVFEIVAGFNGIKAIS